MLGEGLSLLYPVKGRTRWFIYSADGARWQASVRFGRTLLRLIGPAILAGAEDQRAEGGPTSVSRPTNVSPQGANCLRSKQ
jgi:hypothetical protein